jgi:hypothetical protein
MGSRAPTILGDCATEIASIVGLLAHLIVRTTYSEEGGSDIFRENCKNLKLLDAHAYDQFGDGDVMAVRYL